MKGSQVVVFSLLSLALLLAVLVTRRLGGSEPVLTTAPAPDQVLVSEYSSTTFKEQAPLVTLTLAGEAVTLQVPGDLALAARGEPLLTTALVPPCDDGFEYCVYQPPGAFGGTNFRASGLAIRSRPELNARLACLLASPAGHPELRPGIIFEPGGAESADTARYTELMDDVSGTYATGEVWRLFALGTCYEFTLRVVETQFGNHATDTVEEFTTADREAILDEYASLLAVITVSLPEGVRGVSWPSTADGPQPTLARGGYIDK